MGWLHLQCYRMLGNEAQVSGTELGAGAGCHFCPLLAPVSFPVEDSITYSTYSRVVMEEDAKTGQCLAYRKYSAMQGSTLSVCPVHLLLQGIKQAAYRYLEPV